MAEELIYKVGVEGTNELNKLEKSVDKAGKTTGKTRLYMSELRTELRKARGDLIKYAEGTDEYNRALARGSQITAQINEANGKMRAGVQDLGDTTKNVTSTMVGFAGGFQVVQSTMSLFGIENEETIKTVLRLQQTMSIVQGLSAFAQGIDNAQDLIAAFRASNHQLNEELKESSQGMEGATKSSDALGDSYKATGKESAVLGSNLAGNTAIGDKLQKGLEGLQASKEKSLATTLEEIEVSRKYMLQKEIEYDKVAEGITSLHAQKNALLSGKDTVDHMLKGQIDALDAEIDKGQEKVNLLYEEFHAKEAQIKGSKKYAEVLKKEIKEEAEMAKVAKENRTSMEKFTDSTNKARKGVSTFAKTIGKSLLTMGAFLAIIAGVTLAISWLVKKLSEVPENLKITLELQDESLKNLTKDLEKARLFALKYNKAVRDGNEEQMKALSDIGKKEFNLNDAQLKAIGDRREAWKEAFKEYLEIAKDTYYNEALAKRKSEAEVNLQIAQEQEEQYRLAIEEQDLYKGLFKVATERIALDRKLSKSLKEQKKVREEIAVLDKINYRDIPLPKLDKDTGGGGDTRTPSGKAPSLQDRRPDAVEDDASIKLLRGRNALTRELTNEELVIYEENMRKKDTLQDDSEIAYTEYQIKLGQARALDLENQKEYIQDSLDKTEAYYAEELENNNDKLVDTTNAHNAELDKLREYNQKKFDIEAQAQALLEERQGLDGKKDADKIKAIDAEIEALNGLYKANNDNISQSKDLIADHKAEIAIIEEKLKVLDGTPEEIARMKDEITQLNLAIADNSAFLVDSLSANMKAMMEQATFYLDTMASTFNGLESMTGDFMQAEDNKLAKEKNNLELSQAYREADSEQQQQMMYELELANYEAKKKTFETNKAFQIGGVVATSAANQMDIIKAWLDPKTGGPLSPANIAVAAAATIANVTTTLGSIKQISSTSLEKPVPPLSGAGGSGGLGANIALSPNKTSLTSKEENLNSMYKSGKMDDRDTVVKVSEINNVQKRVKVRERNSSY